MIKIDNISKKYEERSIFENFSCEIEDGDFVVITGRSGSGKTTLLNMVGGIDKPDTGRIQVDGLNTLNSSDLMTLYREKIGFLLQNFALVDNKTVLENLNFVDKQCRSEIEIGDALEYVGLKGLEKRKIFSLSGGEQQRVAIARLLVKKCNVILADEPTGNLDDETAVIVLNLIKKLNAQEKTILLVTHDERIKNYANKTIRI